MICDSHYWPALTGGERGQRVEGDEREEPGPALAVPSLQLL